LVLNDIVSGGRVRAQDMILAGPRGVGKTVTVSAFVDLAKEQGFEVVNLQAVSGHAGLVEATVTGKWQLVSYRSDHIEDRVPLVAGALAFVVDQRRVVGSVDDAGQVAVALSLLDWSDVDQDRPVDNHIREVFDPYPVQVAARVGQQPVDRRGICHGVASSNARS
jgi:hypothetical protein